MSMSDVMDGRAEAAAGGGSGVGPVDKQPPRAAVRAAAAKPFPIPSLKGPSPNSQPLAIRAEHRPTRDKDARRAKIPEASQCETLAAKGSIRSHSRRPPASGDAKGDASKQLLHRDRPSQHLSSPRKRGSSRGDTTKRRGKAGKRSKTAHSGKS